MEKKKLLNSIYTKISSPGSYAGINSLYKEAKRINQYITWMDVTNFLEGQRTYGLFKSRRLRFPKSTTTPSGYMSDLQADLADFQSIGAKNRGYRYLLIAVDVLSRMVFGVPVKSKTTTEMKKAFDELFAKMPTTPQRLFTDQGSYILSYCCLSPGGYLGKEFESTEMRKYFAEEKEIDKQCSSDKSVKAGVAERMIRTVKQKLYKIFSDKNTENWVDIFDDVLKSINHSVCRITRMRPIDITPENANAVWKAIYDVEIKGKLIRPKFKKDDSVRIALEKPVFKKGYYPTFSDEIFQIDRVISDSPSYYYLRDYKGEKIKGRFYAPELTRTVEDSESTYRIDKVIKKRRNRKGELEFEVRFIGYPNDTFWIRQSDLIA